MKVVAIVFGSLFALLVVAGLVVLALGSRMADTFAQTDDPVAMHRTAMKIATFAVPPGYRIASATDLGMQQTVTLVRERGEGHGFTLQLQHSTLASDPNATAEGLNFALGLAARVVRCEPQTGIDRIALRDRTLALRAISCVGGTRSLRIETGVFTEHARNLTIIASGLGGDFDRGALVSFLRSIR